MKTYSDAELLSILRKRTDTLTQKQVSAEIGFTPQFVNDVLAERRPITEKLAAALGFTKLQTRYRKTGA